MPLQSVSWVVIYATLIIMLLIVGFNFYVMDIGSKKIFAGSGAPINMAKAILNSIQATSQFLFGIFIVSLLFVLIIEKTITQDVGIPIITSIVGFLLGRTQKEGTSKGTVV
jgi:Flp pilus assembly protein protease CpaA